MYDIVSIEDEPEIGELLNMVFKNDLIRLHLAQTGVEGLALVQKLRPQLLVLDLMLPGEIDGWDVYEAVRGDPAFAAMPIIVLTVVTRKAERLAAFFGSEIDLYVLKPFDTVYLRREVSRMLHHPRLWPSPGLSAARLSNADA